MHKPRLEQLLKYLKRIPVARFDYSNWFVTTNGVRIELWEFARNEQTPPKCETAACVAGHACLPFWEKSQSHLNLYMSVKESAKKILGLSEKTAQDLFIRNIYTITDKFELKYAGRIHAVRRIEYLLEHGNLDKYDFENEIK